MRNRKQAFRRLQSLLNCSKKNPEFEGQYDGAIRDYIERGCAKVKPDGMVLKWNIPHMAVYNPKKEVPRVVNDCKASYGELGLHDTLVTGGRILNSLLHLLIAVRERKFFAIADIHHMYHQVLLEEKDQPYCGLLYWTLGEEKTMSNVKEFVMTRHVFGAKDSPFVACAVLNKVLRQAGDINRHTAERLIRSFYMDDLTLASDDEEQLLDDVRQAIKGLAKYFTLTKVFTSSNRINA